MALFYRHPPQLRAALVLPLPPARRGIEWRGKRSVGGSFTSSVVRVPGSRGDLLRLQWQGRDVRIVYSPLDPASGGPN